MNGKIFFNGMEIKRADEIELPEENKKIDFPPLQKEFSLSMKIKPNPLWKRQQETGIPRRVHLSFLCNL